MGIAPATSQQTDFDRSLPLTDPTEDRRGLQGAMEGQCPLEEGGDWDMATESTEIQKAGKAKHDLQRDYNMHDI